MSDGFPLTCSRCGKRFELFGEEAEKARAFYAQIPDHTPDKQVGVCDECWEQIRPDTMSEGPAKPGFQFKLKSLFIAVTVLAIALGTLFGGLRWISRQVYESERQWRRDGFVTGKYPLDMADDLLGHGWFPPAEIAEIKKEAIKNSLPVATSPKLSEESSD